MYEGEIKLRRNEQRGGTYFLLVLMSLGMTLVAWKTEQGFGVTSVCIFCMVTSLMLLLTEQFK